MSKWSAAKKIIEETEREAQARREARRVVEEAARRSERERQSRGSGS